MYVHEQAAQQSANQPAYQFQEFPKDCYRAGSNGKVVKRFNDAGQLAEANDGKDGEVWFDRPDGTNRPPRVEPQQVQDQLNEAKREVADKETQLKSQAAEIDRLQKLVAKVQSDAQEAGKTASKTTKKTTKT